MSKTEGRAAEPSLIVGVGASAGGLRAFQELIATIPAESEFAFILAQHFEPQRESSLAQILSSGSAQPVVEAVDGEPICRGSIYVVPAGVTPRVERGRLRLEPLEQGEHSFAILDELFSSLAAEYGPRAAVIVLSGTGSDGARGVREVRRAGGLPVVQAPETAQYQGMPKNVASLGGADLVVPIVEMYTFLRRFSELPIELRGSNPLSGPDDAASMEVPDAAGLKELARILRQSSNFELEGYKRGTILRRISRRMSLSGFRDFSDFLEMLRENPRAREQLLNDLLISVTEFFRDSASFEALRSEVIDPTVRRLAPGQTLRAWVAGCATGEEAYSIAMLLLEGIEAHQEKELQVQVFATDIDEASLAVARRGIYPLSAASSIGVERVDEFFHREERHLQVTSRLRDVVAFARHDVVVDPPFSRMHLVSCRNLLIYLKPQRQERVLEHLHFALQPKGYLFLGISETVARKSPLFSAVHAQSHIYKKVGTSTRPRQSSPHYQPMDRHILNRANEHLRRQRLDTIQAQQAILAALAPPTMVVSAANIIMYSQGDLGAYLQFPQGQPELDLLHVVEPALLSPLQTLINRCRRHQETAQVVARGPLSRSGPVRLVAHPAPELEEGAVIVSFFPIEESDDRREEQEQPHYQDEPLLEQLEQELSDTREELRTTVEQLEISNEDLRALHEESLSMNEELQAANEEMEATSEELRSLNEELVAVNRELREKIELLEEANNDLSNFFSSSRIATIFVDRSRRVVRMTPAAQRLFGASRSLIGRTLEEIDDCLLQDHLVEEVQEVLTHLAPQSRELKRSDDRWFTRQILPYRTEDERIIGVVITFVDVTELKRAAERLSAREHQQAVVARLGLQSLDDMDLQRFMDQVVREIQHTMDVDLCMILEAKPDSERLLLRAGAGLQVGLVGHTTVSAEVSGQAGFTLRSHRPIVVGDLNEEPRFAATAVLREHDIVSGISCAIRNADGVYGVLGAHTQYRREFTDHDANFLQSMAALIAAGVSRHYQQVRAKIESETGRIIATAIDIKEAMGKIHQVFFRHLDTVLGEYWMQERDGGEWQRLLVSVDEGRAGFDRAALEAAADSMSPDVLERVLKSDHPEWMTSFGGEPDLVRTTSREDPLLRSGLAIPVLMQEKTQGVHIIYSEQRLVLDPSFSEGLLALSRTLGEYVLRSRAEGEQLRNAARYSEIFETVGVGLLEEDYSLVCKELVGLEEKGVSSPEALRTYLIENPHYTSELIDAVRIINVNEAAVRLLDSQEKPELMESLNEIFTAASREIFIEGLCALIAGQQSFSAESQVRSLQGEMIDIKLTLRFPEPHQGHHRVLTSFVDITENKRYQAELQMASEQKDRFLAMLGHELRNPLAAVYMATQTLSLIDIEDETLTQVRRILDRQTSHMSRLLDGLLDVSRVIRGKITLEEEILDIRSVIQDVLQDLQIMIQASGLRVGHDLPDEPLYVKGDRVRLTQIVDNLLSNALKYTKPPGVVIISARHEGDDIVMAVEDSGIGIDEELLPHIFDTFRQSQQSIDRSAGGLGLGLSLIKGLVELHGGEVWAESEGKNQGARFMVRLPQVAPGPEESAPEVASAHQPRRVLIIEDNRDIADSMARLLELRGAQVAVAYDGPQGLEMAHEFGPDLILCDIGLPGGMSGFDVARQLREEERFEDIRLIAITGYGRREDQQRSLDAGFDRHLTKPVDFQALQQLLE